MPDDEVNSRITGIESTICEIEKELILISYKTTSLTSGVKWFGSVIGGLLIANIAMTLYAPRQQPPLINSSEKVVIDGKK